MMLLKKILIKCFHTLYLYIKYIIIEIIHPNSILINATSYPSNKNIIPKFKCNIGDDINYIIPSIITKRNIVPYKYSLIGKYITNKKNYLFIGSIISGLSNKNSIIIGTGVSPDMQLNNYFSAYKICSVRGPLTKQWLDDKGLKCPNIYGDPALILPIIYNPVVKKKYKLGFIPHFIDRTNKVISSLKKYPNSIILDTSNYNNWQDFIKSICECELIFSSSLHGIIFADAYNIPNIWTHFDKTVNPFKYQDYFQSVGRNCTTPFIFQDSLLMEDLLKMKKNYIPIQYDINFLYNHILNSFNDDFNNNSRI